LTAAGLFSIIDPAWPRRGSRREEATLREKALHPRERLIYSPIDRRPPLKLPDGIRLVVWPVLALEEWDLSRPMARMVISPPQGQPQLPDLPNWSWHEYGMRVGFWRLAKVLQRLGISPTVTLNARVCESYPQVIEACMANNWELNAHSYDQVPMHKLDDQRAVIAKSMRIIEKFSGRRPRGWFGPGLTQTFDTLDHLAAEGIEYIGDWALDDEPVTLATKHRPVVALPYNFELHDIVLMALQHHPSEMMYRRSLDQLDCLYEESTERAKIMSIACHPYLSGVPHRIAHVQRTFEELLSRKGVVAWDGARILDWYLAQTTA
jgi:peptidoglycan/xylan/chitin deacetylase (PgdA/CDA1 family)